MRQYPSRIIIARSWSNWHFIAACVSSVVANRTYVAATVLATSRSSTATTFLTPRQRLATVTACEYRHRPRGLERWCSHPEAWHPRAGGRSEWQFAVRDIRADGYRGAYVDLLNFPNTTWRYLTPQTRDQESHHLSKDRITGEPITGFRWSRAFPFPALSGVLGAGALHPTRSPTQYVRRMSPGLRASRRRRRVSLATKGVVEV
jgi:hypothetical protein